MRVPRLLQTSFIIAAAAFAAACDRTTSAAVTKDAAPQAIVVAKVESHELRRAIDVVGTLAADEEVTVSSEVEGRVLRIAADLGDRVTAGPGPRRARSGEAAVPPRPAARRRSGGRWRATASRICRRQLPAIERTPDVQRAAAELELADQAFRRATELHRQIAAAATADGRRGRHAEGEEGGLRVGAARRAQPARRHRLGTSQPEARRSRRSATPPSARRSTPTSRSASSHPASSSRRRPP